MKQSEWIKDKARHILTRGNMRATINKSRRYGQVKYWITCSELVDGMWRHLFTFPPFETLRDAKIAVEEHRLFRKDKVPAPTPTLRSSADTTDAWWHD